MSKWDEEFDFDDFDAKPAANKQKAAQKGKLNSDDFLDLEEDASSNNNKLPVIPKKKEQGSAKKDKPAIKPKNIYEDYEEIYEEVPSPAKSTAKKPLQ